MIKNLLFSVLLLLAGCSTPKETTYYPKVVEQNTYFTWGIGNNRLTIPIGSIVTDATLTISNASTTEIFVCLIDNPAVGHTEHVDTGDGNIFLETHLVSQIPDSRLSGVIESIVIGSGMSNLLPTTVVDNNMVFELSKMRDDQSYVWNRFPNPVVFGTNRELIIASPQLLQLIDFMGSGSAFGIGIDADNNFSFDSMMLELTIQSFEGEIKDNEQIFIMFNSPPLLRNI